MDGQGIGLVTHHRSARQRRMLSVFRLLCTQSTGNANELLNEGFARIMECMEEAKARGSTCLVQDESSTPGVFIPPPHPNVNNIEVQ
jgi:hypothetical protein